MEKHDDDIFLSLKLKHKLECSWRFYGIRGHIGMCRTRLLECGHQLNKPLKRKVSIV